MASAAVSEVIRRLRRVCTTSPIKHHGKRASVALILRPPARASAEPGDADALIETLEILLIRRTERTGDIWSGHVALPGGKRDAEDDSDLAAAVRETREEVGLDLESNGSQDWVYAGALPPTQPMRTRGGLSVFPFVFVAANPAAPPPLNLCEREVSAAAWVPLAALRGTAFTYPFALADLRTPSLLLRMLAKCVCSPTLLLPAVPVPGLGPGAVLWGMTLRVVSTLAHDGLGVAATPLVWPPFASPCRVPNAIIRTVCAALRPLTPLLPPPPQNSVRLLARM